MHTMSRRTFVSLVTSLSLASAFHRVTSTQALVERADAFSAKGIAMLKLYAKAVGQMMSKGDGDPRAWVFQWYTHAVKGSTIKADELKRVFAGQSTPQAKLAAEMWDTCQSHSDWGLNQDFFLPWHRMYVFYFEEILRGILRDMKDPDAETFALPYWDPAVPDPKRHGVIPPEFRMEKDPVFGVLFRSNRNTGVNKGTSIDPGPKPVLDYESLGEPNYRRGGGRAGFCADLDDKFHGRVHVGVGNPRDNMGTIDWAARDPLFWLHHCNIDRLWASWTRNGGRNPSDDWLKQSFVFADGSGNRVAAVIDTVKEIGIKPVLYTYDRFEPRPKDAPPLTELLSEGRETLVGTVPQPISLGAEPVTVSLNLPASGTGTLSERVRTLNPTRHLYLHVTGLRAQLQPGVLFHIYLEKPPATPLSEAADFRVGTVQFFDAVHRHQGDKPSTRVFSFDVTRVARNLQAKEQLTAKPNLTIAPDGVPASDAKPLIGEISFVEQ